MNGPVKFVILAALSALLTGISVKAQSVYSNAVMSLSPVGYWPMHENEAMVHGDIETNYGSAGLAANGYYGDWSAPGTIQHGYVPGAIAGDPDSCVYFNYFFSSTGNKGSTTNCLIIPHTSQYATLVPPFTVELWYWNTNNLGSGRQSDIFATVNAGGSESGLNGISTYSGIRLYLNNSFNFYTYNNNGGSTSPNSSETLAYNGGWNHIVTTDDGTNIDLYLNGALVISNWPNANYAPNYWDPLEVDTGKGFTRDATGLMQEFAVYTNALAYSDITNHYYTGLDPSPAVPYETLVFNDRPTIFYRFDSPSYTQPSAASLPALANYGGSGVDGVYTAGTIPAGVAGPNNGTTFAQGFDSGTNAMAGSGMSSFADAGSSSLYNPTGSSATFSVAAWFRGAPCDSRVQTIAGHGIGSWGMTMNTTGHIVFDAGTNNANEGSGSLSSDVVSPSQYNDGFWHYAVATHNATANTLFLDGVAVATNNSPASIPGAINNVMIGADASFTNTSGILIALGRQFEGSICEVAMFGAALTAQQVTNLYNAGEMPPFISVQPVSATVNQGTAFTNAAAAGGALPLAYQWFANGAAIAGQTNAALILDPVQPGNAGNDYYVVVANNYGSATSAVVTLSVNTSPQFIGQYPVTYTNLFTLYAGANPTFSVVVSGETPFSYQWFTNGVADGLATNSSLTMSNVQAGQSIATYCVVTNALSGVAGVSSMVWNASVVPDPVNDNIAGNPDSPYPTNVLSLNPIGYWRLNEPEQGGGDIGVVAHDYAGGNDAVYTNVNLGEPPYNASSDPSDYSVDVGSSTTPSYAGQVGTNVDFAAPAGINGEFTVEAWVNLSSDSTTSYPQGSGIVCKGVPNGGEEFALETTATPAFAFLVRAANGTSYTAAAGTSPVTGAWYHLAGVCDESSGHILLYIDGQLAGSTTIPSNSGIYHGSAVNMTIGSRSMLPAAISQQMDGFINDVAVFNYALSSNQVAAEYFSSGIPPYISQQPVGAYVGLGSNLTITATVIGTPALGYQWYETNLTAQTGYPVPAQTNASLVISNIANGDNYYLAITNAYGMTNSVVVSVGVYSSPLIIGSLPVTYTNRFTLYSSADPSYSVSALGFGALSYYWFTNGVPVSGAGTSNLTLANVPAGYLTNMCVVSNYLGTATNVWIAQVSSLPLAPYPQSVMALSPVGYWRMNDVIEDGSDNGNGDDGYICHDYAGGNDGMYTNCYIGQSDTYNPVTDPTDTSAQFGEESSVDFGDSLAFGIQGINFGSPAHTSVAFTIEAWASGYQQTSDAGIVTLGWGSGGEQFDLDCGSDTSPTSHGFRFLVRDAAGNSHGVSSTVMPAVTGQGPWYHLAGVVDEISNQTMTLYINGQSVGSSSCPSGSGILASSYPLGIGSRMGSQTSNFNFQFLGNINDVAIYNYALSAGQVVSQYDAGGGTIAPYFSPTPATTVSGVANTTLTIPVTAVGTPPMSYYWTNVTTKAAIGAGSTNTSATLNASLNYPNVPANWNGDSLELTVSNAYGTTNFFVTPALVNINLNPTNILFSITNDSLTLSWPADHTGWQLQAQTNGLSAGINSNWFNVSGSTTTNRLVIPIHLANGCVFYRLVYP